MKSDAITAEMLKTSIIMMTIIILRLKQIVELNRIVHLFYGPFSK